LETGGGQYVIKDSGAVKFWSGGWLHYSGDVVIDSVWVLAKNINSGTVSAPKLSITLSPGAGAAGGKEIPDKNLRWYSIPGYLQSDSFYLNFTNDHSGADGDRNVQVDSLMLFYTEVNIDTLKSYSVEITWTPSPSPDVEKYKIRWGKQGASIMKVSELSGDARSAILTELSTGEYTAGVAAVDTAGNSSGFVYVNWYQLIPAGPDTIPPADPTNVKIVPYNIGQ